MLKYNDTKIIKRIQLNDLEKCFSFWDFEYDFEKRDRIEREIIDEKRVMYAHVLDGKYIAGMSLQQLENNTAYLSYLVVKKDCRNNGIGTEMIKYACQLSKKNGNHYIKLNVDIDNCVAKELYRKLGFVKTATNGRGRIEMKKILY